MKAAKTHAATKLTEAIIWTTLIVEGSALMALELIATKLLSPYYGSSLYVLAGTLTCTLIGLLIGYQLGATISKNASLWKLVTATLIAAFSIQLIPEICNQIIATTLSLPLKFGTLVSCSLIILPPTIAFGAIGPIAIQLLSSNEKNTGKIVGKAFFTSTLSGVTSTFLFAFFIIPNMGLNFSITAISATLCITALPHLYFELNKIQK